MHVECMHSFPNNLNKYKYTSSLNKSFRKRIWKTSDTSIACINVLLFYSTTSSQFCDDATIMQMPPDQCQSLICSNCRMWQIIDFCFNLPLVSEENNFPTIAAISEAHLLVPIENFFLREWFPFLRKALKRIKRTSVTSITNNKAFIVSFGLYCVGSFF